MRQSPYEVSTLSRILKYLFWLVIILWGIVSFILGYFYLLATGNQLDKKGWTFVEGIFEQVSYLPYLKNDAQSTFYQGFLFKACLHPYEKNEKGTPKQDLCIVESEDDQKYIVGVKDEQAPRSDGVAVTIDDVFFTYDEIIRQNRRGISSLNIWDSVTVSLENGRVTVSFPTVNPDNINFFTNYLLPKHILQNTSLDEYITNFSLAPIGNGCANILKENKDINSLIFDVNRCEHTNFSYYQIKKYGSFEEFDASLQGERRSIVDVYEAPYSLEGFVEKNILTPKLLGIFFNTNSEKVKVRLRRSLGGLIETNFYTGKYEQYLKKYDGTFLNYFVSDGDNVQDLISRINLTDNGEINQQDLKDSGAKELPESITINGVDRKFIFFLQKPETSKNREIKFNNEFENIKITAPDGSVFTPKSYNKTDKKVSYKLTTNENLKVWANQYIIQGTIKGKTYTIASIDLYVFENLSAMDSRENQRKLNVLYYSEPASIFAIQQLRATFKEAGILENFVFEEVFNPEELEGKLLMGSYDLYIGGVNLGSKNDILALFATEDSLLNPSKYRNPILTSLIKQYQKNPDENVVGQINVLLGQDMPIVFLGQAYTPLQMKEDIATTVFHEMPSIEEQSWRYQIYTTYSIVHNIRIDAENAFKWENFINFITKNIHKEEKAGLPSKDPFEHLVISV